MVNVHWTVDLRRRIRSVRLRTSQVAGSRHRDREINVAKLRVTDGVTPSSHRGAAFPSSPRRGTKQPVPSTPWTADARIHTQHDRRTRTIKVIPTRWKSLGVYVFLPKVPRVCHGHHHHHRPVVRRPKSTQVWCMAYVLPQRASRARRLFLNPPTRFEVCVLQCMALAVQRVFASAEMVYAATTRRYDLANH